MRWLLLALATAAIVATFFVARDDGSSAADAAQRAKAPRAAAVATAKVASDPIVERVSYPGELDADAADIAALYAGRLDAMNVRLGDRVAAGDVLATVLLVDAGEQRAEAEAQVRAARAEVMRIKAELEAAQRDAERLGKLGAELVATREADEAKSRARALFAEAQRGVAAVSEAESRVALIGRRETESTVRAPFAGRIVDRYVDPGGFVTTGTRLVRLVASGPLRVRFEVPEKDLAFIALDAKVDVTVPALGGAPTPARVSGIGGEVVRDRRVVLVEATLERHPETWLSGMYAAAAVVHHQVDDAPVVPDQALLTRVDARGGEVVGVFKRDGAVARWVPLTIVARAGGRVAVRPTTGRDGASDEALPVGAEVLVQGHQDLSDGAAIRVAGPPAGAPPEVGL